MQVPANYSRYEIYEKMEEKRMLEVSMICGSCKEGFTEDEMYNEDYCIECGEALADCEEPEIMIALSEEFDTCYSEISYNGGNAWSICGSEYMVLTDGEADDKVYEEIENLLWAFNPDFLANITGLDVAVFDTLSKLYEDAQDAIKAIVEATCTMDDLVNEAIAWDGRGHFLSSYDGDETELKVEGEYYYCYRID